MAAVNHKARSKLKSGDWQESSRLPDFSNATPGFLADELGDIREAKKWLEKMEGLYKDALDARRDKTKPSVEGERYTAVYSTVTQSRISADKVKALLTPEQLASVMNETTFTQVKTVKHPEG